MSMRTTAAKRAAPAAPLCVSLYLEGRESRAFVRSQAIRALERGQRVNVFQRRSTFTVRVFVALPGLDSIQVIGTVHSVARPDPASAVDAGLALIAEAWGEGSQGAF